MKIPAKIVFFCIINFSLLAAETFIIDDFEQGDLSGWRIKEFSGKTDYSVVSDDNGMVLKAESRSSASGIIKKVDVDITHMPYLNWSWKVDHTFAGIDEKSREGDDYPARIYVVVSGGVLFWKTRALNYVWSSGQKVGSSWPNAYTSNAVMIAMQSGEEKSGKWIKEKRNVAEDFRRYFGSEVKRVDAVAVMTDTDNSRKKATAYYDDIYFSSD